MKTQRVIIAISAVGVAGALGIAGFTSASASVPASAPASAPAAAPAAAPAVAPADGDSHNKFGDDDQRFRDHGEIQINERTYSAHPGACIALAEAASFNVSNDSHRTVQLFTGTTCDNGNPLATVGPNSNAFGLNPPGAPAQASFRVVDR